MIAITCSMRKEHIPRIGETSRGPNMSLGELLKMTVMFQVRPENSARKNMAEDIRIPVPGILRSR